MIKTFCEILHLPGLYSSSFRDHAPRIMGISRKVWRFFEKEDINVSEMWQKCVLALYKGSRKF
jgi:hypothetical protein